MSDAVAVDRLVRVLDDHPWLVTALREADWWVHEYGGVRFSVMMEDLPDKHEGFVAFAEAMGMELEQRTPGSTPSWDAPDEPPMSFDDVRRRLPGQRRPRPGSDEPVPT